MKYEDMSDLQVNSAVLCEIDEKVSMMEYSEETDEFFYCDSDGEGGGFFKAPDYCNNPLYAWPIIVENKIAISPNIVFDKDKVEGWESWCDFFSFVDKNPLRAAMICFLKMKEAENANG